MKVFLGGTVNDSKWRDYVIPKLEVDYYNPVVEQWNEDAYQRELYEREHCDFCLYVLTPKLTGFYTIAEVLDDSYKKPDRTIFCYLAEDDGDTFTKAQIDEFDAIGKMVTSNGAAWCQTLDDIIAFLNSANQLEDSIISWLRGSTNKPGNSIKKSLP